MSLTAGAPFFLSLMPLAALPVLFHLFLKMRKRPHEFSTLMFFHRIDPKLSARKKVREWIVLLLRSAFIALLLAALSRPLWVTGAGGGSVAVVAVVDNSGSMSAPSPGGEDVRETPSKQERAVAAAEALIDGLEEKDSAAVITLVDDPTTSLPEGLTLDREKVRKALGQIPPTAASGSPKAALEKAFSLLENSAESRFEVHVFTDLQEEKWGKSGARMRSPRQGTTVVLHHIPSRQEGLANIAISGMELRQKRLLVNRPAAVAITLYNPTPAAATALLQTIDDSGKKSAQQVALNPFSETTVEAASIPRTAGFHWLEAVIEGDAFTADNRASIGFLSEETLPIVFVGQADEYGLLPMALSPTADGRFTGLVPTFLPREEVPQRLENDPPVCVVARYADLGDPFAEAALRNFADGGGNLILVPTTRNPGVIRPLPEWTGVQRVRFPTPEAPLSLLIFQKDAGVMQNLRNAQGEIPFRRAESYAGFALEATGRATPLIGLEDGRVVIAERTSGKGRVFLSAFPLDAASSNLPRKYAFVLLTQAMALYTDRAEESARQLVAGQRLADAPEGEAVHIRSISGSPLDWKGARDELPVMPRAGVYRVEAGGEETYFSVRSSDREGRQSFVKGPQSPALVGLAHTIEPLDDLAQFAADAKNRNRSVDLFLGFLILAIGTIMAEGWIVNRPKMQTPKR